MTEPAGSWSESSNPPAPQEQTWSGGQTPPSAPLGDEEDRTRNGLRKRTPRTQRGTDTGSYTRAPNRVIDLDSAPRSAAIVNDSPAEVSARLTALRAGIQRGKAAPGSSTPRSGQGNLEHEVKETE